MPNKVEISLWTIHPSVTQTSTAISWDEIVSNTNKYYLQWATDIEENIIYHLSLVTHNDYGATTSLPHIIS